MKSISEFSFSDEPGRKQLRPNKGRTEEQEEPKPLMSIVTPYYNAEKNFEQTYCCIINQTFGDYEWIIVDDGSSRSSAVQQLADVEKRDTRIKVLRQKNRGQSVAKNNGIRNSRAELIVFIDADDLIEPFYLEILYKALKDHPDASWSYTDLAGFGSQNYIWSKPFSAGRMTFNNTLVNAAAFRKSALEEVGYFPELWKHYDEDWALYLKLLQAGKHPVHVPVIGFWYRRSDAGMQQTVRNNEHLRKQSDEYIMQLAQEVDIHIKGEEYRGELPEDAVESSYSRKEKILAFLLANRFGVRVISGIYRHSLVSNGKYDTMK